MIHYEFPPNHRGCAGSDRGVEHDWLNFYWYVRNKTSNAYSYAQLHALYRRACNNGSCLGWMTPWASLAQAANSLHGVNSAKANHWINSGSNYGMNY